ncbi:MAG: hypothetical protein K940chlam3_00049 [Chlamydiae bacterium]|nr:hypothetical protein [Chlamydiota bacterium]
MVSILIYLGIGALGGILAGLLGLGGGLIVVPCLAFTFAKLGFPSDILMHFAIGSSLAAMITTTFFSTWAHHRMGTEILPIYKLMAGGIIIGSFLGALTADFVHSVILSVAFGGFALIFSFQYFLNIEWQRRSSEPNNRLTMGCSVVIGMISALLGIGAGTVGLPFLTSYEKAPLHQAVGIAAALSFTVSIFGTISYLFTGLNEPVTPPFSTGYIYWPAVLGISLGSPLFAWGSARVAHMLPVLALKRIFAVVLFVIGIRMLFF